MKWEGDKGNISLKLAYIEKQKELNRQVRKCKRRHARMKHLELYEKQLSSPKAFWKFIKSLGNAARRAIKAMALYYLGGVVLYPCAALDLGPIRFE